MPVNEATVSRRLALLIDGDNASPADIGGVLSEIAKYGRVTLKRIYGDWAKQNLDGWRKVLAEHSITPIQQPSYTTGKNATDTAMIIDAMDILYGGRIEGFCIMSSDSDFTRLASRLRESGQVVYGFGAKKTPKPFVAACDKFTYVEILKGPQAQEKADAKGDAQNLKGDAELMNLLRSAIEESDDESGWSNLGAVGKQISSQKPEFDPRQYGFAKLSSLLEAIDLFEVRRDPQGDQGHAGVFVRSTKTQRQGRRR
jgi:uncharacterized LabA/DUF88 family protein